jgi:hypothetical protein
MATTAKTIVPAHTASGQKRKPMTKQHKAKLVAGLATWRASLTDDERAELAEQSRTAHRERWAKMTKKERDPRLAGVRAWQAEQRAARAAKERPAAKAKPAPRVRATKAPAKPSPRTEVSESAVPAGTRKAGRSK